MTRYAASRPLEIRINGTTLLSDIVYRPFGPPKAWTWGNGVRHSRQYDHDGRLTDHLLGTDTRHLDYDLADRLTQLSHGNPGLNRSYAYDPLDRLSQETDNVGTTLWTYDANGNRTRVQPGSADYAYTYPETSNRLQSIAGPTPKTYTHDAAGNITHDGTTAYTYNAAGRLSKVERTGKANGYRHNAQGERVIKNGAYLINGPHRFIYDPQGRLIGEYDKNNQVRQETVWLGDTPIAVLKPDAGGQLQIHYVHSDHLDTPRAILNPQNRIVWQWPSDAFGQGQPNEDLDRDGKKFEYNPRFPGQYYDKESGLHFNTFRDYDPGTGRYVQGDPIGLAGGLNVYGYVGGNPLSFTDPAGLCAGPLLPLCYYAVVYAEPLLFTTVLGVEMIGGGGNPTSGPASMAKRAVGASCSRAAKGVGKSLDDLSRVAGTEKVGGFTQAGHSLQKHGSRPGSKWSQSDIDVNKPGLANARGQDLVDDVLTTPGSRVVQNPRGGTDVIAPDGRVIRYNRDVSFQGFRE